MAGVNAGALYLPVKLDVANAQGEIDKLGQAYRRAFSESKLDSASFKAMTAQIEQLEKAYANITAQAQALNKITADQAVIAKSLTRSKEADAKVINATARQEASETKVVTAELHQQGIERQSNAKTAVAELGVEQQKIKLQTAETNLLARQVGLQKQAATGAARQASALKGVGSTLGSALTGALGAGAALRGGGMFGAFVAVRNIGDVFNKAKEAAAGLGVAGGIAGGAIAAAFAGATLAATGLVAAIGSIAFELGKIGIQSAMKLETLGLQLEGLLGSAGRAKEELSFLLKLGETSTVPTESLIAADRQLAAFGVTADGTRRDLVQFFSDFGTATSATESQIYFLSLALSQVASYGKANTVDLRQLANAGINVGKIYKIIADQMGVSTRKVKEGVSDGIITADRLFAALDEYGAGFADTAEKARKSTAGLLANIQDIFVTRLGVAFAGVNKNLSGFLEGVQKQLEEINFAPIAKSFQNAIEAVGKALGQAIGNGGDFDLKYFFETTLPDAIYTTGKAIAYFIDLVKAGVGILRMAIAPLGVGLAMVAKTLLKAALQLMLAGNALHLIPADWVIGVQDAANGADEALAFFAKGAVEGANDVRAAWENAWDFGITPNATPAGDAAKAQAATSDESLRGRAQDYKAATEAAKKLRKALQEIIGTLNDKFLDEDGKFTASAKEIRKGGKEIVAALFAAMPKGKERSDLVAVIEDETDKLAALAKRRDRLAKQLAASQDKLKSLIQEKADFAEQIRSDAISYVNDLTAATEKTWTVTKWARDGIQGWSFTQETDAKAWAEGLKKRLQDYRDFVANIRKLQARGLDPQLLRQMIEAGPAAAGELASGLAGANNATIRDVNQTQDQLNSLAEEFGTEQSSIYYDAGIDAARSVVKGLKEKVGDVDRQAKVIIDTMRTALKDAKPDLVKTAKNVGESTGQAIGTGIKQGLRQSFSGSANIAITATVTPNATPAPVTVPVAPNGGATTFSGAANVASAPTVQVFIGEREITDIVDTRISYADRKAAQAAGRGNRYPVP